MSGALLNPEYLAYLHEAEAAINQALTEFEVNVNKLMAPQQVRVARLILSDPPNHMLRRSRIECVTHRPPGPWLIDTADEGAPAST